MILLWFCIFILLFSESSVLVFFSLFKLDLLSDFVEMIKRAKSKIES